MWWAQVTVIPLASKMAVFRRGTWKGLMDITPSGGQWFPNSKLGANLEWKKAQKNERKNRISEVINRTIPQRSPWVTCVEWNPCRLLSRETSRHHWNLVRIIIVSPIRLSDMFFVVIQKVVPNNREKTPEPIRIGQGLVNTIWKGWLCFIGFSKIYGEKGYKDIGLNESDSNF